MEQKMEPLTPSLTIPEQATSASPEERSAPDERESCKAGNSHDTLYFLSDQESKINAPSHKKRISATAASRRTKITVLTMFVLWTLFSNFTKSFHDMLPW
jgi:hypothetical protein